MAGPLWGPVGAKSGSADAVTRRVQRRVHLQEELMVSRRTFLSLVAAGMSAPQAAFAQPETRKVALYANVGADLTHYDVDVAGAALTRRATVTLPAGVQYAWPHVSRRYLYVATTAAAHPDTDRRVPSITSPRFASTPPVARSPSTARRSGCP